MEDNGGNSEGSNADQVGDDLNEGEDDFSSWDSNSKLDEYFMNEDKEFMNVEKWNKADEDIKIEVCKGCKEASFPELVNEYR